MKVAIVGYGRQGRSAYEYWAGLGADVTVCDTEESLGMPTGAEHQIGEFYLKRLDRFDLIVRAPHVHPQQLVEANTPDILQKVTTTTNEFFRVSPTKNLIGVTGAKGKGTTATLIAKMLEADGKRVYVGGNIGVPPLDLLAHDIRPEDWVVLEMEDSQLLDLQYSPHVAICLMVSPGQSPAHDDTDETYNARTRLFRNQTPDDIAIYYEYDEASKRIASTGKGWKIPYMEFPGSFVKDDTVIVDNQPVCAVADLKLPGEHNWQNVCAAVTAYWKISQNIDAARVVLSTFTGLEHRLEFVRSLDDVRYYDDSFGSTPDTAIVAIKSFAEPKVVILGGTDDKGVPYDDLAAVVKEHAVRGVVLIGEQADRIRAALDRVDYTDTEPGGDTMAEIVSTARSLAQPGDVVLLSPACSGLDMFQNYLDRAEQFKTAVNSLA